VNFLIAKILLLASFFVFLAVAAEAKVRSGLGLFIVVTGLIIGILNLIYVLLSSL
jgi:hypothetical protein